MLVLATSLMCRVPLLSLLFASIALLFVAPVLHRLSLTKDYIFSSLHGLVFVLLATLIGVEIIPTLLAASGPTVLFFVLIGLLLPTLTEKLLHRTVVVHKFAICVGVIGLAVHTMADGATLALEHTESSLSLGVVLHRVPIGMFVWWFIRPHFGSLVAYMMLALIAAGTLLGFTYASTIAAPMETTGLVLFQSFVVGTLIHVLFHKPPEVIASDQRADINQKAEGLGNLLGLLCAFYLLAEPHNHGVELGWLHEFSDTLLYLTLEMAPMLLLAFLFAGIIKAFMPDTFVNWLMRGSSLRQASKGMAVGIPLPLCSCSVVPVYHSLITKGVPKSAAIAFLIATPELGIDALLISLPLLGAEMTLARLIGAALLAVIVALVVSTFTRRDPHHHQEKPESHSAPASFGQKLSGGMHYATHDLLDHIAPWILVGLLVASLIQPFMGELNLASVPGEVQVLMFAALGIPVYVCASSATPLVAIFLINGVSPGAGLAFLLAGPATNVSTFGILVQLHGRNTALLLAVSCFTTAVALGLMTNFILADFAPLALGEEHHHFGTWSWVALSGLLALFGYSIYRKGLRAFLSELKPHSLVAAEDCGHNQCSHHSH